MVPDRDEGFATSMILGRPSIDRKSFARKSVNTKPTSNLGDGHSRLRPIEGRHNALVKELRGAFADGDLTLDGYCAIEGVRIIEEAVRSGLKFRAIFFRNSSANVAGRLLPQMAASVETLLLPDKLFASCVPSETPQGVAALVRCKQFSLEDVLAKTPTGPLLAIAGVQDPEIWAQSCGRRRLLERAAYCSAKERLARSTPK